MAFPTTSVLDNFDRANGSPGGSWSAPAEGAESAFSISSDTASLGVSTGGYWNSGTFGPNSEVFCNLVSSAATYLRLLIRLTNPGVSSNGYVIRATTGTIFRLDSGSETQLGASISTTWADNDQFGADAVGDTITLYKNGVSQGSRTDSTYQTAGYIGWTSNDAVITADNFGGGTIASGPTGNEYIETGSGVIG